ncbi:hypothetical protein D4N05_26005 [Klebsiella oxytoca]|nr:hypothetical protein D4N05_26005 [Klebsiella oxytoca]
MPPHPKPLPDRRENSPGFTGPPALFRPSPFPGGRRENLPPFFESHHNRRTPLFPFCPRRLN